MTKRLFVFDVMLWLGLLAATSGHTNMIEPENGNYSMHLATQDAAWNVMHFQLMQRLDSTELPTPLLLIATIFMMIRITRPGAKGLNC